MFTGKLTNGEIFPVAVTGLFSCSIATEKVVYLLKHRAFPFKYRYEKKKSQATVSPIRRPICRLHKREKEKKEESAHRRHSSKKKNDAEGYIL